MRENAITAVTTAVYLSHVHRDKDRAKHLLDGVTTIFEVDEGHFEDVIHECSSKYEFYSIHLTAHLSPLHNLFLMIHDDDICRQEAVNSGEPYQFELGNHPNFKVKFDVVKLSGERKQVIIRSASLLKRLLKGEKRADNSIDLADLPLGQTVNFPLKSYGYSIDITMEREVRKSTVPTLEFEDLLEFIQRLHEYECQKWKDGNLKEKRKSRMEYDGELSDVPFAILHTTAIFHLLPPIIVEMISLANFLVWDNTLAPLSQGTISKICNNLMRQAPEEHHLSLMVAAYLSECVNGETERILTDLVDCDSLFPPGNSTVLKELNVNLRSVSEVCALPLWTSYPLSDPLPYLTNKLALFLSKHVQNWVDRIPFDWNLNDMCHLVLELFDYLKNDSPVSTVFFRQFGINYLEVSMRIIDKKICECFPDYLKRNLNELDSRNEELLDNFTKCTMKIYDTFNNMLAFAKKNGIDSLQMESFESWFESIAVFWTYSWRSISKKMVERTISLADEEDDRKEHQRPLPAGLYSFLCIQKGISDDFSRLALKHPSNLLMTTIAIINIFCENSYAYCKRVYSDAFGHGHRRRRGSQLTPPKWKLARAMNGMEKALNFVEERWDNLLEIERVKREMEPEELGAVRRNAESVLKSTREKCESMMKIIAEKVATRRKEEIIRIAEMVTSHGATSRLFGVTWELPIKENDKWEHAISAVENLVGQFHERLEERCCRITCAVVGRMLEEEICKRLKSNDKESYYGEIYMIANTLCTILGVESVQVPLLTALRYKSFSTKELLLLFYEHTIEAQSKQSSNEFLRLQCGYSRIENENNIVYLHVHDILLNQSQLPPQRSNEVFLRIELLPKAIFPDKEFPISETKLLSKARLHFSIPAHLFYQNGCCLSISACIRDRICVNTLCRTLLPLNQLNEIPLSPMTTLPSTKSIPLFSPHFDLDILPYQILRERIVNDKLARAFVRREGRSRELHLKSLGNRFAHTVTHMRSLSA